MRRVLPLGLIVLAVALPAAAQIHVELGDASLPYDQSQPAAGHWLGNLQAEGRLPETWASLLLERDESGRWSASVTLIAAMVLNVPCEKVSVNGRAVSFVLPAGGTPRFTGTVSDDGQRLAGEIEFSAAQGGEPATGAFELGRSPRPVDLPELVAYSGTLSIEQMGSFDMTLAFARTAADTWVGHVDVPVQGLLAFPLINVKRDGRSLSAQIGAVPYPATIEATLGENDRRLTGRFKQGPFDLPIDLARNDGYVPPTMNRPQHPEPPFPYPVRDVQITHPDGHVLAGTLALPAGPGPHPAAVLISGSGPQDRDETLMGHKPFLVIADRLARDGIATLRFDDRGTGRSTGRFVSATSADFASDAEAVFEFLQAVEEVDAGRVGLIGHSEGGILAPMVAARRDDVAFIVMLAGTGVPGDELLMKQGRLLLEAAGAADETIAALLERQQELLALLRSGGSDEQVEAAVRAVLEVQLAAAFDLEGEALDQIVQRQMRQLTSGWMRTFLTYDPRPTLMKVRCPVLAVNGTLDLQVWHEQNLPEIEKAVRAGGGEVTIRRYEGLNHLFQPATTGSPAEYVTIETTFDEAALRDVAQWIRAKTGAGDDG